MNESNKELEYRIELLQKEIIMLKEILHLEEAIQIMRGKSSSPFQSSTPPWAPEPVRFMD